MRQIEKMKAISTHAALLFAALKDLPLARQSSFVEHLEAEVRQVNVGLLMLLCDVLKHPDINLPRSYLTGFNVTWVVASSDVLWPKPQDVDIAEFWQ